MKKIILCTALLLSFLSNTASADAINELQQRLQRIEVLSANYVQSVTDPQGKNIQQAQGKLQIKRPNLFRMETHSPQETQIISDGKSLWFYDPFVEQVTIHWVKEAINNTPFVLLTSDQTAHWQAYEVSQSADTFTLKPKSKQSHISAFSIRIDADGTLRNFSTQEKDGQVNLYLLRNITNQPLPNHLFSFTPSKGTEIDDQRKPSN